MATLPGLSIALGVDGTPAARGFAQAQRQADQFARQTADAGRTASRGLNLAGGAARGLATDMGVAIRQISAGQDAVQALSIQLSQAAFRMGPWGAAIGAGIAAVAGLSAAFLTAGKSAKEAGADFARLRGELDKQIDSVDRAKTAYRELSQTQLELTKLNLSTLFFEQQAALDEQEKQLRSTVLEFGQLGAAMAGLEEGTGALSNLTAEFLTGRMSAARFAAEVTDLADLIDNAQFTEFAKEVRASAVRLGELEAGSEGTRRRLQALDEVGHGLTQTADEIAKAHEREAAAMKKATGAAQELTAQQKRLQQAGAILLKTSAGEERFTKEQENVQALGRVVEAEFVRRQRLQEQALREQTRAAEEASRAMAVPMTEASPEAQAAAVAALREVFA